MKMHLVALLFFPLFSGLLQAQQLPLFTHYREMHGAINPAIFNDLSTVFDAPIHVGSTVRIQWVGREGAPRTQLVHGEWLSGNNAFSLLAGGYIINDQAGQVGFTGVHARVASVWLLDPRHPEEGGFASGMSIGAVQFRVDFNEVIARDPDPLVEAGGFKKIRREVGVGMFAWRKSGEMTIYGGVSAPQATGTKLEYRTVKDTFNLKQQDTFRLDRVRHYYGMAGFMKELNSQNGFLELSAWVKYVPHAPLHLDLNLRLHRDLADEAGLWIGAGASTARALHAEIGVEPGYERKLKIGYSFDFNVSNKILKFGNSHEISLSLALGERR